MSYLKTIILRRNVSQKGATNGFLYLGYRRLCATLERTMFQLPEGNYQLRAKRLNKLLVELCICHADTPLKAPRPENPLGCISAGNGPYDITDGSIYIGEPRTYLLCLHGTNFLDKIDKWMGYKTHVAMLKIISKGCIDKVEYHETAESPIIDYVMNEA